jgi:PPK2 family polyphosphate:nucleotide phosphotransferase
MKVIKSPHLVPTDGTFRLSDASTQPPKDAGDAKDWKKRLEKRVKELAKLQRKLYADDRYSLLLVFQALDAAGKDGTIRGVMSGVDPAGFQVFSFKKPSAEELDHDFLWRTSRSLPERGRIGIFNRSYYEEVLVVRVHPEFIAGQKLPYEAATDDLWAERFESIVNQEHHLARNGTVVLKFFLNVSRAEQKKRFLSRIDDASKNWKFSIGDVIESRHYEAYMEAYEEALRATSKPWAPWYAIPADDKDYMRAAVADVVAKTLASLPLRWPEPSKADRKRMMELREELVEG